MGFLNLLAKLNLNATGFDNVLTRSQGKLNKFSKSATRNIGGMLMGVAGVAAIKQAATAALDHAGKIKNMADRYGVATDALQEFDFAARQHDATLNDFGNVLKAIQRRRAIALEDPNNKMASAFKQLGVSVEDLKTKDPATLLKQMGAQFKKAGASPHLFAAGMEAMGDNAKAIFPALIAGLEDSAKAAHGLGAIASEDKIRQMTEWGDMWDRLKFQVRGMILNSVPYIKKFGQFFRNYIHKPIAGLGAFIGAKMGGASFSEALDISQEARDEIDQKAQQATDNLRKAAEAKSRALKEAAKVEFRAVKEKKLESLSGKSASAKVADNLAKIGGFTSRIDHSARNIARRQLEQLRDINKNTRKTDIFGV